MVLLREILGETLRQARLGQRRTLREVSASAGVSLGYLSEVERGQKEASSELLASICQALDMNLVELLQGVGTVAGGEGRFKSGVAAATQVFRTVPPAEDSATGSRK